ncbi:MAG: hypothetical protein J0M24_03235 [Verrucomicrobia bacterium]|nr:hypothetical protein [Verrucomicrobiota bacterium]
MALLFGVAVLTYAIAWRSAVSAEPSFAGKRLSSWLDELCEFDSLRQQTKGTNQIAAIRAIGTNAIPWLLRELHQSGGRGNLLRFRLNQFLEKQTLIQWRVRDAYYRDYRATVGFKALGEIAQPAILELLTMVEANPAFVPGALAGIGRPAVPALMQCVTNTRPYTNQLGVYAAIPGNTISALFNATSLGNFSKADTGIFLPAIQAWAIQTTNMPAQSKAQFFLEHYSGLPD